MNCLRQQCVPSRALHISQALNIKQLKNTKNKSLSSQLWLQRQINDPYVELARRHNYRCRSAFKLLEVNEKFKILLPGKVVIDCGAAPGSWTQVAVSAVNADQKKAAAQGYVYGIDIQPIHPIDGAQLLGGMDFMKQECQAKLLALLGSRKADVVLSDMAPSAMGIKEADHDSIMQLAYIALKFALTSTEPGGTFLVKVWDGGRCLQFEKDLHTFYKHVKIVKPDATRTNSSEKYFLARDFKGLKT